MKRAAALVVLALSGATLRAGDAVPALTPKIQSMWEREYATGDWGGLPMQSEGVLFVGEMSYRCNQVTEEELSATRTSADARPLGAPAARVVPQRGLAGSYEAGVLYHTDSSADIGSSLSRILARLSRQPSRAIAARTTRFT